ncbi:MAG: phosphate acyltransferase PlsX [Gammaproteobacteria bacterium]
MTVTTIAIDAMGGDFGPPVTVPAAVGMLAKNPALHLILVGDAVILQQALASHTYDATRLTIQHASQRVEMDESPAAALRLKKDSSMRIALNLVKAGDASACVSAGNTGALMATARFVLKTLPGIDRPAIVSLLPTHDKNKNMRMLDLGANVDSSAEHLLQFAVMGSILASSVDNVPNPKVALLNIGEEDMKGNEQVKQTAQLLSELKTINYVGFIEGDDIYTGKVDVVVCDGFVGNVALKTTEGTVAFITLLIKIALMKNIFTKLVGLLVKPILKSALKRVDPTRYNGATFIGLQGTVIKSHGGASAIGFMRAIEEAILGVEKNVPARIRDEVEQVLKSSVSPRGQV